MPNHSLFIRLLIICNTLFLISCHFKRSRNPSDVFLADDRMDETSGIVASTAHPGILYIHNDSGDSSRFFAITPDGQLKCIYNFKGETPPLGVKDCEDITLGSGPDSSASYIYLGDIGDNFAHRNYITIYRIKEPTPPLAVPSVASDTTSSAHVNSTPSTGMSATSSATTTATPSAHVDADPLFLRYPDGPRDAETLMADPIEKILYIVSKREDSVHVYSTPLYFKAHDTVTLTKNTSLYLGSGKGKWITAGNISPKGDQILLKSYRKVFYWRRPQGEHVWVTLQRRPLALPYLIEGQGEAICFTPDGKGYYTISEGLHPQLFHYKVPHLKFQ
jgi:hypothetical protein